MADENDIVGLENSGNPEEPGKKDTQTANDHDDTLEIAEIFTSDISEGDILDLTEIPEDSDWEVLDLTEVSGDSDDEILDLTEVSDDHDILDLTEVADDKEDDILDLTDVSDDEDILDLTEVSGKSQDDILDLTEISDDDGILDLTEISDEDDILDLTEISGGSDDDILDLTEVSDDNDEGILDLTEVSDDHDIMDLTEVADDNDEDILDLTEVSDDHDIMDLTEVADDGDDEIQDLTGTSDDTEEDILDLGEMSDETGESTLDDTDTTEVGNTEETIITDDSGDISENEDTVIIPGSRNEVMDSDSHLSDTDPQGVSEDTINEDHDLMGDFSEIEEDSDKRITELPSDAVSDHDVFPDIPVEIQEDITEQENALNLQDKDKTTTMDLDSSEEETSLDETKFDEPVQSKDPEPDMTNPEATAFKSHSPLTEPEIILPETEDYIAPMDDSDIPEADLTDDKQDLDDETSVGTEQTDSTDLIMDSDMIKKEFEGSADLKPESQDQQKPENEIMDDLSISMDQLEKAIENIIEKKFYTKIETLLDETITKVVSRDIEKLKQFILDQKAE